MPSKVQTAPESPGLINQRCEKCGALRHVEPYRQDGNPDGILLCYFCSPDGEIDREQARADAFGHAHGCVCHNHMDIPSGVLPGKCEIHAGVAKPWAWRNGSGYLEVTVNAPSGEWCNRWMWDHRRGFCFGVKHSTGLEIGPSAERYREIFDSEQFLILQVEGVTR